MDSILYTPWQSLCKSADQMAELMNALKKAGYEQYGKGDSFNREPYVFCCGKMLITTTEPIMYFPIYDTNIIINELHKL